jgi:hypothetical protein
MFAPCGEAGCVATLDLGAVIAGLLTTQIETGPGGEEAIEFGLALNQPPERTEELIRAASRTGLK